MFYELCGKLTSPPDHPILRAHEGLQSRVSAQVQLAWGVESALLRRLLRRCLGRGGRFSDQWLWLASLRQAFPDGRHIPQLVHPSLRGREGQERSVAEMLECPLRLDLAWPASPDYLWLPSLLLLQRVSASGEQRARRALQHGPPKTSDMYTPSPMAWRPSPSSRRQKDILSIFSGQATS